MPFPLPGNWVDPAGVVVRDLERLTADGSLIDCRVNPTFGNSPHLTDV